MLRRSQLRRSRRSATRGGNDQTREGRARTVGRSRRRDARHVGGRNIDRAPPVVTGVGVPSVPGPHLKCLRGIPSGWSRVAPRAERRPAHRHQRRPGLSAGAPLALPTPAAGGRSRAEGHAWRRARLSAVGCDAPLPPAGAGRGLPGDVRHPLPSLCSAPADATATGCHQVVRADTARNPQTCCSAGCCAGGCRAKGMREPAWGWPASTQRETAPHPSRSRVAVTVGDRDAPLAGVRRGWRSGWERRWPGWRGGRGRRWPGRPAPPRCRPSRGRRR
ncbi:hypothetical protein GA0070558_115122 [Micromonospora haikouensis]|uniref:Uncharacterized protein n=1 Tax=Micromonospora haikouensis TaxID=686309 RepID=A0A1C4WGW5_9ACTN|nr:hypothetical protein GA0070558_115122 [Micromonospora haikouensis]